MAYEIAVVLGFLGISFISAYLAMNIDRKQHGAIQILLIFVSMASWLLILSSIQIILEVEGKTELSNLVLAAWWSLFLIIFFMLFYVSLGFIYNLKDVVKRRKANRKDGLGGDMEL